MERVAPSGGLSHINGGSERKGKRKDWTLKSNMFPRKRGYRANLVATRPHIFGLQILLPLLFPVPCQGGETEESIHRWPSEVWSLLGPSVEFSSGQM